jgi:hypothetical protein
MPKNHSGNDSVLPYQAPKYDEKDLETILRFLAACLIDAMKAMEQWRLMCGPGETNQMLQGNLKYWQNVCSAIRWVGDRATKRQTHLLAFNDDELQEIKKQWLLHSET